MTNSPLSSTWRQQYLSQQYPPPLFRLLQAEPPGEVMREGRRPSEEVSQLAQELMAMAGAEPHVTDSGYHLFARRIARDLGFAVGRPEDYDPLSPRGYDPSTAGEDGFMKDKGKSKTPSP